jgi:putative transposase
MLRAFKYRIYPNQEQQIQFAKTFGCNRFIWNQMLAERISIYEQLNDDKETLYAHKYKSEKEYKQEFEFLKEVDSISLQQTRLNLNQAYLNFYRRVKKKVDAVGFPKFKSKRNSQSFKVINTNENCKVDYIKSKLKIPKLGWIKFKDDREFDAKIKSITISKNTSNQYFASILVDTIEKIKEKVQTINKTIALDMSAKSFAISEDKQFTNPKFYRNIEKKLGKLQCSHSRKQSNSKNKERSRLKLAKFNQKMLNRKKDWLHKLSHSIVNEFDAIFVEDLNLKGMQKFSSGLSKTISLDFNWGEFITMVDYKSKWYGKHFVKVGRYFASSQTCSDCGSKNSALTLSDRQWVCPVCGCIHDRDVNASKNIKREGLRILVELQPQLQFINNTVGTTEIYACEFMNPVTDLVQESLPFRAV